MPLLTVGNPIAGTWRPEYFLPVAADTILGFAGNDLILGDIGPVVTGFGTSLPGALSIDAPALWSARPSGLHDAPSGPFATLYAAPPARSHLWYAVTIGAGETLDVRSDYIDTVFRLFGPNGTVVINPHLDQPGPLAFTAPAAGTYYLQVLEFSEVWPPRFNDGGIFEGDEEFLVFVAVSGHAATASAPTLPDDLIRGGAGRDRVLGEGGNDTLHGNPGEDTLMGGDGNDWLHGGNENDLLYGGAGDDAVIGGAGDDVLHGEQGADTLSGGLGNDLLRGGGLDDLLRGAGGDDVLHGDDGADRLFGEWGNDRVMGWAGRDSLYGGMGQDELSGGDEADLLHGGGGDDVLFGSAGADVLTGGPGADRFIWTAFDFGAGLRTDVDRITDFSPARGDRIDLSAIDADPALAGNNAFVFIGQAGFSGTRGELRFAHEGGNTFVEIDRSGDGLPEWAIRLDGVVDLSAADFIL